MSNYLTENEKNEILELYSKGLNTVEIGKILHRNDSTIGRYIRSCGYKNNGTNSKLTQQDKELIKDLYLSGMSSNQIYNNYFKDKIKCSDTILYNIKKMDIPRRNRGNINIVNHNYFNEIDTHDKGYFLGLLLMDGNVFHVKSKGNCWMIQIQLVKEDKYILEKFKQEVGSDNKIIDYKSNQKNAMCHFSIFSYQMANDLKQYGIVPRKSLILNKLPNIKEEYMPDLIRGIFDGNGSVYTTSKYNQLHFTFYSTHNMLDSIRTLLMKVLNFPCNKIVDQKKENVSLISFSAKKDIKNFYNYIYYNDNITCLKRKKKKFDDYLF